MILPMPTEQTPARGRARTPVGDNGISAARLRMRKHPSMVPAIPLVPPAQAAPQEILLRLVALESQVERLQGTCAHLEEQIRAGKTQEEETPAEEPSESPVEPVVEPAEEPSDPEPASPATTE